MKDIAKGFGLELVALFSWISAMQNINVILEFVLLIIGNASAFYGLYIFIKYGKSHRGFNPLSNADAIDRIHNSIRKKDEKDS